MGGIITFTSSKAHESARSGGARVVVARGRVIRLGEALAMVPSTPFGVEADQGRALVLTGTELPPVNASVSVRGDLAGRHLHVAGWQVGVAESPVWTIPRDIPGVDPSISGRVVDDVPDDWEIVSVGESTVRDGGRVAVLELYRVPEDLGAWLARQEPGSVLVYPFIREEGAPELWVAGAVS
jgi:hypothetical protein